MMKKISQFSFSSTLALIILSGLCFYSVTSQASENPISFSAFAPAFEASDASGAPKQWYRVDVGYTYSSEEPPGDAFVVDKVPEELMEDAHMISFKTLLHKKHQYANYTWIEHDPLYHKLETPFALGEAVYALVKNDTPQGINLSYYYYDSGNVAWASPNKTEVSSYTLDKFAVEHDVLISSGKWFVQITGKKEEEFIKRSERQTRTLYQYVFLRIMRL